MKTFTLILLSFLFSYSAIAQLYEVDYQATVDLKLHSIIHYKLLLKKDSSFYYKLSSTIDENSIEGQIFNPNSDKPYFFIKDYKKKQITYKQDIITKSFYVQEDLPLQRWKMMDELKTIQSFNCKKATTSFRGKTYTAWYTEEISTLGGPWKFDGLPGLILEISADDNTYIIQAKGIKEVQEVKSPVFPYDAKKLISWQQYCKEFQGAIRRLKKRTRADNDPEVEYEISVDILEDVGLPK